MWGLVLILVVLVLLLGLGYLRLLSALKDLQEQIQKKLQNGSGVRLTSQVSKKELVALTKQVSDLFEQIERTNRIAFQEKKTLDMAISNIAHDIRTPLTIASGYTQQIIKGGTQEEEKLKKNCFQSSSCLQTLGISLGVQTLDGGSHPASDFRRSSQPSANPAVIPVL